MPLMALSEFDGLDDAPRLAQTVLGLMPDTAVLVIDCDLRVVFMEGDRYAKHGYDIPSALGKPVSEVMPEQAWARLREHWIAAVGGEPRTLDWESVDGLRDYWLHFAPLRTKAGRLVGAISVAQDITERVRARRRVEIRLAQQAAVSALGTLAVSGVAIETLLERAAQALNEQLEADMAIVVEHIGDGFALRAGAGEPPPAAAAETPETSEAVLRSVALMRDAGQTLLSHDLLSDTHLGASTLAEAGMRSLVAAPVGSGDAAFGSLVACSHRPSVFTADDEGFVKSIANVLMAAVERDRTNRRAAEAESEMSDFWALSRDLLAILSPEGHFVHVSDAWEQVLGWTPEELTGRPATELLIRDDRPSTPAGPLARGVADAPVTEAVSRFRAKDGSFRWLLWSVRTGPDGTRYAVGKDVTDREEERAVALEREEQLRRSEERFRQGFDQSPIGMTLVDPTTLGYARVNDAYCRLVGRTREELLTMSFVDVVHPDDAAAARTAALQLARSERDSYTSETRYRLPDGSELWASLHVTPVLDLDSSIDVLFGQMTDVTERRAKEATLRDELAELSWIGEVRRALAEDRFELHAQPIVDLASGDTVQHELLLRMRSRDGELIAPGAFLPAAEKHGAIREIDRWVIAHGADLAATGMHVEINLSAASLGDPGLIADIERELRRTGADPPRLVFEITETALIEKPEVAVALAGRLRELGCRFALDDFGSGYGGFHYLKHLPIDFLKIEREFIRDAVNSDADQHVIHAIVGLARGFGLQVIAEGVEDQETLDLLRDFGVDHVQGFFTGRPAPLTCDPQDAPPVRDDRAQLELIRRAFEEDGFLERRRPIVDLATGTTIKDALCLDLPVRGGKTLAPDDYSATVRAFALSTEIDDLALRRAIALARRGQAIAIRASAESLTDPDLSRRYEQTILDARVDPALLTIELAASGLTANAAGATTFITRLRALGCAVTVDGFIPGDTDLGIFKRHPVDCIRLDAGCLPGLTPGSGEVERVRFAVQRARDLGIRTAADGVEDDTLLELLRDLGIDEAQGALLDGAPSRVESLR